MTPDQFIDKWQNASLKERSAYQSHFNDLCQLYSHPTPVEKDPDGEFFCFEAGARKRAGGNGWADVWYKGHFAIEYKGPGANLDKAFDQLEQYRRSLENPPLLITCNIQSFRIKTNFQNTIEEVIDIPIASLREHQARQKLGWIFTDPNRLKPHKTRDEATIEVANKIGAVADSIRGRGVNPNLVARFLDRVVFCLFAEDAGLLPDNLFSNILARHRENAEGFSRKIKTLFAAMNQGGDFGTDTIPHFNGQLFHDTPVIDLTPAEIRNIHDAASRNWTSVNPAIFGTLFERVLSFDTKKRAQLGAHYTSETDINVLIEPVILAPLRDEWFTAKDRFFFDSNRKHLDTFHQRLKKVTVLDPACGSGNFLYVSLQKLLDLELDVLNTYQDAGLPRPAHGIGPWNLRGIEKEPIAFQLAQMAVWIGYLQWMSNHGTHLFQEPILRSLSGFYNMDAILKCDATGNPVTPPEEPAWPEAEFIVGNPPFLGANRLRLELGDNYIDNLQNLYEGNIKTESDICCYWFDKSRRQIKNKLASSAGLLATQAIRSGNNREVLKKIKEEFSIYFAISDQDWILEGANVHVSFVAFDNNDHKNAVLDGRNVSVINPNLTSHADTTSALKLIENDQLCFRPTEKGGKFEIDLKEASELLNCVNSMLRPNSDVIRPWVNAEMVCSEKKEMFLIDFFEKDQLSCSAAYEIPFKIIETRVKPERQLNRAKRLRDSYWLLRGNGKEMRNAVKSLEIALITPRVSKHRVFYWIPTIILPDSSAYLFATDDNYIFGVLHSRFHETWALGQGSQLREKQSGFRYTPTTCFETFPFPEPTEAQRATIAEAARDLNEQRENWLNPPDWTRTEHLEFPATVGGPWSRYIDPTTIETRTFRGESFQVGTARWPRTVPRNADYAKMLKSQRTLTKLYNDRPTWLDLAHRRLDEAVATAYGWSPTMTDEQILAALLELNLSRPALGQDLSSELEEEE